MLLWVCVIHCFPGNFHFPLISWYFRSYLKPLIMLKVDSFVVMTISSLKNTTQLSETKKFHFCPFSEMEKRKFLILCHQVKCHCSISLLLKCKIDLRKKQSFSYCWVKMILSLLFPPGCGKNNRMFILLISDRKREGHLCEVYLVSFGFTLFLDYSISNSLASNLTIEEHWLQKIILPFSPWLEWVNQEIPNYYCMSQLSFQELPVTVLYPTVLHCDSNYFHVYQKWELSYSMSTFSRGRRCFIVASLLKLKPQHYVEISNSF